MNHKMETLFGALATACNTSGFIFTGPLTFKVNLKYKKNSEGAENIYSLIFN